MPEASRTIRSATNGARRRFLSAGALLGLGVALILTLTSWGCQDSQRYSNDAAEATIAQSSSKTASTGDALAGEAIPTLAATSSNDSVPLRALVNPPRMSIGAMVSVGGEFDDPRSRDVLAREFNLVTPGVLENAVIEQWGFGPADSVVSYFRGSNVRFRGQNFFWDADVPSKVSQGEHSRTELIAVMRDRVRTLTEHFGSTMAEWVVVNEAIHCEDGEAVYRPGPFYLGIGPEYIEIAFRLARRYAPNAVLLYNDFDIEVPGPKTDAVFEMVKGLKDRAVPIDGIGMQFHIKATSAPTKDDIISTMRRFAALGLSVYVTELDVDVAGLNGTAEEKLTTQAQIYRDIVEACVESGVCRSITVWGISDKYSWLLDPRYQGEHLGESPLLFDEEYQPKPAYFAVREALEKLPE